jgi:RHS repeat-associated protein
MEPTNSPTCSPSTPTAAPPSPRTPEAPATPKALHLRRRAAQPHTTQLVKFGARWYDPTTGNWTQQDTLNAPLDPANGNRYTYAADNPTNNTGPTGLDNVDNVFDIASGVAVVVAGGFGIASALSVAGVITSPGAVPLAACAGVAAGTAGVLQGAPKQSTTVFLDSSIRDS